MKKVILQLSLIAFVLASVAAPAGAQEKIKTPSEKTREITIYVYQTEMDGDTIHGKLVPVKRRIADRQPLGRAIKLLLAGVTKEEKKRGLSNFIYELKFVSARVVNGTAQIKFNFIHPDIAEESWEGGGFDRANFNLAVEQTARQFPGIERVSFCIEGQQGLTDPDANGLVDCPF